MTITDATFGDALWISKRLRAADLRECEALETDPTWGLLQSVHRSEVCYCVKKDGYPVLIFGVTFQGQAWMMGTDEVRKLRPRVFLEHSKDILGILQLTYPILSNLVHRKNKLHLRWLKALGATFTPMDEEFLYFTICA